MTGLRGEKPRKSGSTLGRGSDRLPSDQHRASAGHLVNEFLGQTGRSLKLTSPHLLRRLRMRGALLPPSSHALWREQGQIYLCTVFFSVKKVLSHKITADVIGMCIPCMFLTCVLRYLAHMHIVHIILTLPLDGRHNGLDSNRGTEVTWRQRLCHLV